MANPRKGQKRKASNTDEKTNYSKKRKDDDEDGSTQINSLPDDVLIEIVKLLPVAQWPYLEQVSRRFRAAVFEAWRGLKNIQLDKNLLGDVTKKKKDAIRVLNLISKELTSRASNMTDLSGFLNIVLSLNHAPLRLSRSGNSKLEKLTNSGSIDAMNASRSTTFNSSDISYGPIYLISLLARAKNLTSIEFDFRTIYENEDDDVRLEETKQLLRAIAAMENLTSLKISDDSMHYSFFRQIRSEFVEMIAELGCRGRLEEFLLPADSCICTKDVVSAIANNMTHLKSLELCPDYKTKKVLVLQLVTNLKRLENFRLTRLYRNVVNDETISAIATNMPNLTCLHLEYTSQNQPESLEELVVLNNLKELCIEASDIKVDTSTMEAWSEAFGSKLEVLRFSPGIKITKRGLMAMIDKATRLRHLATGDMTTTDRRLLAIASSCRELRKLEVAPSRKLTSEGIQALVDGCTRLERFGEIYYADEFKIEKVKFENDRKLEFVTCLSGSYMTVSHVFWDWP